MISFRPGLDAVKRAIGLQPDDFEASAVERWEITPAERRFIGPAKFLPGQIERIKGTAFGSLETVVRDFRGGFEAEQEATLGFRFRSVDLVDGVLYGPRGQRHLRKRHHRSPVYRTPEETARGALYESWVGNRWFGNWLLNDCLTYRLAEQFGDPGTTAPSATGHMPRYEALLGMSPRRIGDVHFDDLIIFHDFGNNSGSKLRADDFRRRMTAGMDIESHAGTFLLRGATGDRRVLRDEREIAERMARDRGFRVIEPQKMPVEDIVAACAGARVIAGVEGSQLVHGLMVMPPDASLLVIQPPQRVVSVLKATTDRQGQTFSFVVAQGGAEEFEVGWGDVARTLDLLA